jgi:hypothetical protein
MQNMKKTGKEMQNFYEQLPENASKAWNESSRSKKGGAMALMLVPLAIAGGMVLMNRRRQADKSHANEQDKSEE